MPTEVPPPPASVVGWVSATQELTIDVTDVDELCLHAVSDNFQGLISFGMFVKDGPTNISYPCRMFSMDLGQYVDRVADYSIFYLKIPPSMIALNLSVTRTAGRVDFRKYTKNKVTTVATVPPPPPPPPPPPVALYLGIFPFSASSGDTLNATVMREGVTTDALVVNIASSDTTIATVPATVTIPASQDRVVFPVTLVAPGSVDVTVSADGFVSGTNTADCNAPVLPVLTLRIWPYNKTPGNILEGTVTREGPTTEDLVVTVTSSDTTRGTVPATVTIPAGKSEVVFPVQVVFPGNAGPFDVRVTAPGFSPGENSGFSSLSVPVPVPPPPPPASSLTGGWKQNKVGYSIDVSGLNQLCLHILTDGFVGSMSFIGEPKDSGVGSIPVKFTNITTGELVDRVTDFSQNKNLLKLDIPCVLQAVRINVFCDAGKFDIRKWTR